MPARVVICDDSHGFVAVAQAWVQADPRLVLAGTAGSARELVDLVAAVTPDVVLLDLVLPDAPDPAALIAELRERHAAVRVVLTSSLPEAEMEQSARKAGADGFVTKLAAARDACDRLHVAARR